MSLPPPKPRSPDAPALEASAAEYAEAGARAIDLSDRPVADSLREVMASSPRLARQSPPPLPSPGPAFSNRHWTLAIFGLLHLAGSFLVAGETVWHVATGGLNVLAQDPPERARLLVFNPYCVVWGLVLGIGLIFARRWARALTSASFLLVVLWACQWSIAVAANNADLRAGLSAFDPTPAWEYLAMLAALGVLSYAACRALDHRNVRLTCEAAQPQPDWTDRRSTAELLLFTIMVDFAVTWAGRATHQPVPFWGVWRRDWIAEAWGGWAALAALAALLVMAGRTGGPLLAGLLALVIASSVAVTAARHPAHEFVELWGDWDFNRAGGLVFVATEALLVILIARAALRSRRLRLQQSSLHPAPAATDA